MKYCCVSGRPLLLKHCADAVPRRGFYPSTRLRCHLHGTRTHRKERAPLRGDRDNLIPDQVRHMNHQSVNSSLASRSGILNESSP
eukprot:4787596-Pyramimonas_sp.AAC.1